jgi:hypothetical protein
MFPWAAFLGFMMFISQGDFLAKFDAFIGTPGESVFGRGMVLAASNP